MAKITSTFDTDTQELSVKIDGEEVQNVVDVSICKHKSYEGKDMFQVRVSTMIEEETAHKLGYLSYVSKASANGVQSKYSGLYEVIDDCIDQQVMEYFGS